MTKELTKQELVELYNSYLDGTLSNEQEGDLWEGIYYFSNSFLCYIQGTDDTKQDILEDLIYDLMTMNSYYKPAKDFKQLTNIFVSKLKHCARRYHNWENKEASNGKDQTKI